MFESLLVLFVLTTIAFGFISLLYLIEMILKR